MATQPSQPPPNLRPVAKSGYAGGPEMSLLEHLKELRNRVIICAAALIIGSIVCFYFWEVILGWLLAPARVDHPDFRLTSLSPVDRIGTIFKIGMYGGLIVSSPIIFYEILAFIVPGLTPRERRILAPGLLGMIFFMMAGMAFAYWIVLPASLGFLLDLGSDQIETKTAIQPYMDFVIRIVFWVGIAFELPVILALVAKLGLVRAKQLLRFWRYAIVIIVLIAAVITPTPDPYNQMLVAGPLFVLYFIGVLFAWILQPRRPPAAAS